MVSVCLYFKVHQPYQLKKYLAKDIDVCHCYEDKEADKKSVNLLADNCCLPANKIIYKQIIQQGKKFKISFSISGIALELFQQYRPDVIQSFQKLASTGCIEFLAEPYYHSLSSLHSKKEFRRQVVKHTAFIKKLFGMEPVVFKNTELIHNNLIGETITGLGMKGILCEGVERVLKGRNNNEVYAMPGNDTTRLLLRNASLSDDIAFRFGDSTWSEHPLTADKFADWLHSHASSTEVINLFMDYETFGVHKKKESGIFEFLEFLPVEVLKNESFIFSTPGELLKLSNPRDVYDVPEIISWEDRPKTNCLWCENVMQNNTLKKIYSIENLVMSSNDEQAVDIWGRLQAADYFYYMGERNCPTITATAHEIFRYYTNLVADFEISLIRKAIHQKKKNSVIKNIPFNILSN